jgi:hypothetical protein
MTKVLTMVKKDYPCKGDVTETYIDIASPYEFKSVRARQSRVKPALYFLQPTAQPLAYEQSSSYGERHFNGVPYKGIAEGRCTKPGSPWSIQYTVEDQRDYYPFNPSLTYVAQFLDLDRFEPWQNKFRDRVADLFINVGEDVVQWRSTVTAYSGLTDAVGHAWRAYKKARKGQFKSSWELAQKSLASAVVGWDFGLAPTLSSLDDSLHRLHELRQDPPWEKIRVFQTVSDSKRYSNGNSYTLIRGTRVRKYVFYAKKTGVNQSIWTMGNPAELAWNLTPFSWVVDYAIGVGDYLTRIGALTGVSISDGTVTEQTLLNGTQFSPMTGWTVKTPAMANYRSHVRSVILSNQIPSPKMDWWKFEPRWNNLADTVSVWRQMKLK